MIPMLAPIVGLLGAAHAAGPPVDLPVAALPDPDTHDLWLEQATGHGYDRLTVGGQPVEALLPVPPPVPL